MIVYMYVFLYLVSIRKKTIRNDASGETYWRLINLSIKQSKQNKLFAGKVALFGSNINEGIRAVLFLNEKISQAPKAQKRIQANKNKNGSVLCA